MVEEISNYYIRIGVDGKFSGKLSNMSHYVKELKKTFEEIKSLKYKKAILRRDFFENMISLRLNIDKFRNHLPSEEFKKLQAQLVEIEKYQKLFEKEKPKKKTVSVEKKKEVVKKAEPVKEKVVKKEIVEEDPVYSNALDSEKKELELLKKDLEEINAQLNKK